MLGSERVTITNGAVKAQPDLRFLRPDGELCIQEIRTKDRIELCRNVFRGHRTVLAEWSFVEQGHHKIDVVLIQVIETSFRRTV